MRLPIATYLLVLAACSGTPVGRVCDLGVPTDPSEIAIVSPALDCVSRTCLKMPLTNPQPPAGTMYLAENHGLCTAPCESDEDCARVPESPCVSGFTCRVAVTVGPMRCAKLCMCKDYVEPSASEGAACEM